MGQLFNKCLLVSEHDDPWACSLNFPGPFRLRHPSSDPFLGSITQVLTSDVMYLKVI